MRAQHLAAVEEARAAESEVSASFGFSPRKTGHVDAETRAQAVLKLRATRKARGTMGSRQKADVHGSIETPVAPTPAPSEPAVTTPAPAPVATSGVNGTNGASSLSVQSLPNGSSH